MRVMDEGSDYSSPGSFARITGTVASGKQQVVVLKKQIFLVMESPIIRVVGEKRGRS